MSFERNDLIGCYKTFYLFTRFAVLLKVCLWVIWKWSMTFKNMTMKLYRLNVDYSATWKTSSPQRIFGSRCTCALIEASVCTGKWILDHSQADSQENVHWYQCIWDQTFIWGFCTHVNGCLWIFLTRWLMGLGVQLLLDCLIMGEMWWAKLWYGKRFAVTRCVYREPPFFFLLKNYTCHAGTLVTPIYSVLLDPIKGCFE